MVRLRLLLVSGAYQTRYKLQGAEPAVIPPLVCYTVSSMTTRSRAGFTVVELLIAVSILVVVIAIIVLSVNKSRDKAADARTQETLATIRTVAADEKLEAADGYAGVCSSEKVREAMYTLAAQLGTIDYACVSSSGEFVVAFPLKAEEGYWCVDAEGASGKVSGLPTVAAPHTCEHVAPSDGSGGPVGDGGSGGGPGEGGSGEEDPGGELGINQSPTIFFDSGSTAIGGAMQMCAGSYCVVVPDTADPDLLAFVSAADPEDGSLDVEIIDEESVHTSDIPTNGPGPDQKTIPRIGVFNNCEISANEVTYQTADSEGVIDTASRTFLICQEVATPDVTAPSVAITAPADGATVADSVPVSATASDGVGVVGVSFIYSPSGESVTTLIESEDTAAPYALSWDTTGVPNGSYELAAIARDVAGNSQTSAPVTVTVDNEVGAPARKPLLFSSGFEGTSGTYLAGFENPTQSCCAHSLGQSMAISREGAASLRTEVRANDSKVSGGWRAEVLPLGFEDVGDRWYGWSVYFDAPQSGGLWLGNYGGEYVHWNSNIGGGSKLSFNWNNNNWNLVTDPDLPDADHFGFGGPTAITAGAWHDIVVHANWETGLLEAWIDGTLFFSAPAGSGLIDEDPGQYFKFGMVRWGGGAGGKPTGSPWVIYYDSLRVGDGAAGVGYYDVAPGDY